MSDENRPNPEELLEVVQREERGRNKGKLKIFLGMAAGVGKTYTMLEEAQQLKEEGADLVVGVAETHGREETAMFLEGLTIIPLKKIQYRGVEFREMDLDAIINRKPQLAIVDELAHSNVPGSRHAKRWQDVMELLDNGIDVYTTLNVQHIESLNDIVEGVTGVTIRETVPDLIVETATFIQLVDLTPDELLQRLKEGKVYFGDQSNIAASHFFQMDRLTALREIVLRYAAEKVEHDLHTLISSVEHPTGWKHRERLLVAVSPSPHSQKLIRTARRFAFTLNAPWIVVYVNDGKFLSENENNMLAKNLSLARDLGAEVITTSDPDVAAGIQRIARQKMVTQIIIGRPPQRAFFDFFKKYTILDRLARECSDIDVHVMRQEPISSKHHIQSFKISLPEQFGPYIWALAWVLLLTGFNWISLPIIGYKVAGVVFLLGILSLSLFLKKGPIFFAAILYAFIWSIFFTPPGEMYFNLSNEDSALLILYFLTAIATGILVDRARENKEMLSEREASAQALYEIVRQIASAPSIQELLSSIKERLETIFKGSIEILVKAIDDGLVFEPPSPLLASEKEKSAAIWAFENEKEAGWSTMTLPSDQNLYIPLKGYNEVVGVLVYRPQQNRVLTTEEKNFLYTVGQQLANYLERSFVEEREREIIQRSQVEEAYQTVFQSISEELKNPLTSIQEAIYASVQALKFEHVEKEKKAVERQIHKIENSSERLSRILDNVSSMAKLSGALIPIHTAMHDVKTLIEACRKRVKKKLTHHQLVVNIQENLPKVPFDFSLIESLLQNLILNAIAYSPAESTIEIDAHIRDGMFVLSVADEGEGIPQDMLDVIFESFYRLPGTSTPGMGLGLSIAKRIAEMHQGFLVAENRPEKGAKFSLFLPLTPVTVSFVEE